MAADCCLQSGHGAVGESKVISAAVLMILRGRLLILYLLVVLCCGFVIRPAETYTSVSMRICCCGTGRFTNPQGTEFCETEADSLLWS